MEGRFRSRGRRAALGVGVLAMAAAASVPLAAAFGEANAPSYARDVAPILRDNCVGCHTTGGIAPFSLERAGDAQRYAPLIGRAVADRAMPPWPPGGKTPPLIGARTLPAAQRATLLAWVRGGAKVDRPVRVSAPARAGGGARAGETTLALSLPAAYAPRAKGGGSDDYRCFLLDPKLADDVFVTSAEIVPGVRAQVHHVILFKVPPGQVAEAARMDGAAAGPGWSCFGGTGLELRSSGGGGLAGAVRALDDSSWLAAWAPGGGAHRLPDGAGSRLAAGSRVIVQVHYNLLNGARPDRSRAVLTTVPASAGLTPVSVSLVPAPVELPCAKGERGPLCDRTAALADNQRRFGDAAWAAVGLLLLCGKDAANPPAGPTTFCDRRIDRSTTVHAVAGHMHLLGVSIRVELNPGRPDRRVLLDIPRWDFHWQGIYRLKEPVEAKPGDVVRVTCRHDAGKRRSPSAGHGAPTKPRYVLWGEGTVDEMCLGVLEVTRG